MNILPGEPLPPPSGEQDVPVDPEHSHVQRVDTEPQPRPPRWRPPLGRALSLVLMIALASGPAAVQAFREGVGAPSDVLACEATIGALNAEGAALEAMLSRWADASDDAISGQVEHARAAMAREDVDSFVDVINRVVDRCHDVSDGFTQRFDAFCQANPGNCQDRVRLF